MSNYFEIAYAAASRRLCLFTGTGFSKAVTANAAPSWQALLESLSALLPAPTNANLKAALFPTGSPNPLPLEEAAQIIDIELQKIGKSAHEEIANFIRKLVLAGDNKPVTDFIEANTFEVVTTNYDKLFEQLALKVGPQTITPGLPVPRSAANIQVYHVHGSIDSPRNMVVTSDDYFRFLNSDSYFAKKLSTILHENTVVILGYSLGDTNLKTILSDYKGFSRTNVIGGNIFLVSRGSVDQHIKDYYAHSFAIRVIDQTEVLDFFRNVNAALPDAIKCAEKSKKNIKKVLYDNHSFTDNYLQIETSFFEIIASISAIGSSLNGAEVVKLLGTIIERKIGYTNGYGAWSQYGHLARWLTYLASLIDLAGTEIQDSFLKATLKSMESMSKGQELGYSWQAYRTWSAGWTSLTPGNRNLVRSYIQANTKRKDALELVARP
ncbi:SIR2 family protein [Hydrogenophaga sp.]|uniref:SIR2 family NAD-dependent protein deacylase n=1 Tax=Hydrogenophaga sp. TaxID=1904254 RepID=UPI0035AEE932